MFQIWKLNLRSPENYALECQRTWRLNMAKKCLPYDFLFYVHPIKQMFVALVQVNKRHRHFSLWTTQRNIFCLRVLQRIQAPTKEQNSGQGHSQQPLANPTFWIAISIAIFSTGSQPRPARVAA